MSNTPSWRLTSALIARTKRANPDADVTELLRQRNAEQLEERIRRALESDLRPTADQRHRLSELLENAR